MLSFCSRRGLVASATVAVVLAFAAATANARSDTPNVCKLISASQLATFHVSGPCTQKKTTPLTRQGIHAGTFSTGRWGNLHQSYVIAVLMVINPAYVSIAKQKFFNGGTSAGVGDWSRWKGFANGKESAEIVFAVGNKIVDFVVAPGAQHRLKSKQQVISVAKAIAGQL
jgi:hypothetical protein